MALFFILSIPGSVARVSVSKRKAAIKCKRCKISPHIPVYECRDEIGQVPSYSLQNRVSAGMASFSLRNSPQPLCPYACERTRVNAHLSLCFLYLSAFSPLLSVALSLFSWMTQTKSVEFHGKEFCCTEEYPSKPSVQKLLKAAAWRRNDRIPMSEKEKTSVQLTKHVRCTSSVTR